MRDAVGRIETVALIGGSSDIGLAAARALGDLGARHYIVAGRPGPRRKEATALLEGEVLEVDLDLRNGAGIEDAVDRIFAGRDVDVVILAAGRLAVQPSLAEAIEMAEVNYVGMLGALLACAGKLLEQGHGQLVVMSSAGVTRPRPSNYLYGSGKAGLDYAARGLAMDLRDSNVTLTVIRAGHTFTKMTAGIRPAPLAVGPEAVGRTIVRAVAEQTHGVVWVPRAVSLLAHIVQFLPGKVVAKLER